MEKKDLGRVINHTFERFSNIGSGQFKEVVKEIQYNMVKYFMKSKFNEDNCRWYSVEVADFLEELHVRLNKFSIPYYENYYKNIKKNEDCSYDTQGKRSLGRKDFENFEEYWNYMYTFNFNKQQDDKNKNQARLAQHKERAIWFHKDVKHIKNYLDTDCEEFIYAPFSLEDLSELASKYLEKPYLSSRKLEVILIDAGMFTEIFGFTEYVIKCYNPYFKKMKIKPLLLYSYYILFNTILFFTILNYFDLIWGILFLICPFSWSSLFNKKSPTKCPEVNAKTLELHNIMRNIYNDFAGGNSGRHFELGLNFRDFKRCILRSRNKGVSWPFWIISILDRITSKTKFELIDNSSIR